MTNPIPPSRRLRNGRIQVPTQSELRKEAIMKARMEKWKRQSKNPWKDYTVKERGNNVAS